LSEVDIPKNVTSIGVGPFKGCKQLQKITVDSANTEYSVESNCLIDVDSLELVQGCTTSVIPPYGTILTLGMKCFAGINIETAEIPEGIEVIPAEAFSSCSKLAKITLPSSLQVIGDSSFILCRKLSDIALPADLRKVGTYAFDSCTLTYVRIPKSIEQVQDRAFGDMATLKTVVFEKNTDADGNIIMPIIHHNAFSGSGAITFKVPWSEQQHNDAYSGTYTEWNGVTYEKSLTFGAKAGSTIIFDYVED
jgi:hypothetical protein